MSNTPGTHCQSHFVTVATLIKRSVKWKESQHNFLALKFTGFPFLGKQTLASFFVMVEHKTFCVPSIAHLIANDIKQPTYEISSSSSYIKTLVCANTIKINVTYLIYSFAFLCSKLGTCVPVAYLLKKSKLHEKTGFKKTAKEMTGKSQAVIPTDVLLQNAKKNSLIF